MVANETVMKRMKGLWLSEESVLKYQNAWLELSEDRVVGPDGKPGTFATVTMKPGVSVLAMDDRPRRGSAYGAGERDQSRAKQRFNP